MLYEVTWLLRSKQRPRHSMKWEDSDAIAAGKSADFSLLSEVGSSRTLKTYSKRGALLYCVALPDVFGPGTPYVCLARRPVG